MDAAGGVGAFFASIGHSLAFNGFGHQPCLGLDIQALTVHLVSERTAFSGYCVCGHPHRITVLSADTQWV